MRSALLILILAILLPGCGNAHSSTSPPETRPQAGGEKSIEDFGAEASGAQRAALLAAFHGYLGAIAARDYAGACAHLAAAVRQSLDHLAPKRVGCPLSLSTLLVPTAAAISRQQDNGSLAKVRAKGDRAFIVFHAPGAKLYQLTMVLEAGAWKAATLSAAVLVPSEATLASP